MRSNMISQNYTASSFETHHRFEAVNEFTDWMKDTLEEAKLALAKAKDDMAQYYNRCQAQSLFPNKTWSQAPVHIIKMVNY